MSLDRFSGPFTIRSVVLDMNSFVRKALLLILSSGLSVLAAEIAVSITRPQNLSGSWRVETETGLLVNKSRGSSRHQLGNRVVSYEFVSPHLRGPVDRGSVKALVLGDSFTFGWLLGNENNYVNLLQRKINTEFGSGTISLLNAAAGGWGTGDHVAFVEDFGDEIRPDIILVFLNTDDIGRALRSPLWTFDEASRAITRTVPRRSKLKTIVNAAPGYQWLLEHSHLVQLARRAVISSRSTPGAAALADGSPALGAMKTGPRSNSDAATAHLARALGVSLFRRLQLWCRAHKVHLAVATTGWHQSPPDLSEATSAFVAGADELFSELGIPFFDASSQIWLVREISEGTFIIPGDGHPNEDGAALIAEHVFPFLSSQLGRYCRLTNRCTRHASARP